MADGARKVQLHFMVSQQEKELILEKMRRLGTKNMGAYLRKMAIDGYVVKLDMRDITAMTRLLRQCGNNLNQYARRANETGSVYLADIEDVKQRYDELCGLTGEIVRHMAAIG